MKIKKAIFGGAVLNTCMFTFNLVTIATNGSVAAIAAAIFTAIGASYCWAESFAPETEGKPARVERAMYEERIHEEELNSSRKAMEAASQQSNKYLELLRMILGGKWTGAFDGAPWAGPRAPKREGRSEPDEQDLAEESERERAFNGGKAAAGVPASSCTCVDAEYCLICGGGTVEGSDSYDIKGKHARCPVHGKAAEQVK